MRVKTDEKRQNIVQVASTLFQELGFERTSMSAIAAKLGGSKATLYGYFRSKEELFAAVMVDSMEERGYELVEMLERNDVDFRKQLLRFGEAYLNFLANADIVANSRTAIGAAMSSNLGAQLYELGPRRFWGEVSAALERRVESGDVKQSASGLATLHLQGLLEAGYAEPLLFGAAPILTPEEAAKKAVDVFLMAYGAKPESTTD